MILSNNSMIPAMRNPNALHTDFGFLRGFIPSNPNFMPSNIDMVLERRGVFLFGEWKREEEEMKQGQKILLTALAWHHTVIIITGYVDDKPHIGLIQKVTPTGNLTLVGEGEDALKSFLTGWYVEVERGIL